MNQNLKSLLQGMPELLRYVVVLGLVMLILYFCLKLTSFLGRGRGKEEKYDDPEAYEKSVPDVFASTFLKRKPKPEGDAAEKGEEDAPSK